MAGIEKNDSHDEENSEKPFKLKTKTGSVWGTEENKQNIKDKVMEREQKKVDNRKRFFINLILSLGFLAIIIILIILQQKYDVWFPAPDN